LSIGGIILFEGHTDIKYRQSPQHHIIFVSDYLIFEFIIRYKNCSFIFTKCSLKIKCQLIKNTDSWRVVPALEFLFWSCQCIFSWKLDTLLYNYLCKLHRKILIKYLIINIWRNLLLLRKLDTLWIFYSHYSTWENEHSKSHFIPNLNHNINIKLSMLDFNAKM